MYDPSQVVKSENCGKFIAEPKELIITQKPKWNKLLCRLPT